MNAERKIKADPNRIRKVIDMELLIKSTVSATSWV